MTTNESAQQHLGHVFVGLVIQGDAALWDANNVLSDSQRIWQRWHGTRRNPFGKWWEHHDVCKLSALASRKRDGTFIQSKETRCL